MSSHETKRSEGHSFISELYDEEDGSRATGRFTVHWESVDERREHLYGPDDVPLEEAISWGREHAPEVTILLCGSDEIYSVGEEQTEGEDGPLPLWPDEPIAIRPRPAGTPLDGSVQEIEWKIAGRLEERIDSSQLSRLEAQVRADARVERFSLARRFSLAIWRRSFEIEIGVKSRGGMEALLTADRLIMDAVLETREPQAKVGDAFFEENVHLELGSLGPYSY